jgi:hypothetical protein
MGRAYAIKAEIADPGAAAFSFSAQKTMYGGKLIDPGDSLFVFASETQGGQGLVAMAVVTTAWAVPPRPGPARQTPRVDVAARRTGTPLFALSRREMKGFGSWGDGRPETELNFKLYRQATNKIVGLSDDAERFLRGLF